MSPYTFERLNLVDFSIRPCLGCLACQKVFDEPGCRQKDDALAIFTRPRAADLIVYATPRNLAYAYPDNIRKRSPAR